MNTHHHWDHAGGNEKILESYSLPVIGGKDCAKVTQTPAHNSTFKIGQNIEVTALHTPCHTQDSICWYMRDTKTDEKVVFTGDTLFIGGCGRFFEGTPKEMHKALNEVLAALPDDTKVYPGHEYTKANVKFLVTVDDGKDVKALQKFADENKETQGKFTIGDEVCLCYFPLAVLVCGGRGTVGAWLISHRKSTTPSCVSQTRRSRKQRARVGQWK